MTLKKVRLIWACFAMSFVLFAWTASLPSVVPVQRPSWGVGILALFAVYSAWSLYRIRRKILSRASRKAAEGDPAAAARFASAAYLFSFMSAESTMVCGVLAQLGLHAPSPVSWSFYLAGATLLLLYWPAKPAATRAAL